MSSNKLTRATQEPAWVRYTLLTVGLGFLFFFLGLPLVAVFVEALAQGVPLYLEALKEPETRSAIWLTVAIALAVLPFNVLFGVAAAWAIAKFEFKGKSLLITLIDLPFAVSPVVAGLIFILLFGSQGYFGEWLSAHEIKIVFAVPGMIIATLFITFPFIARELIPLMQSQGKDEEEAAVSLGASRWQTFTKVIFPAIGPALLTGFALAFARALGEFGSVIFIAGNLPLISEIVPLLIISKLEQYDVLGATALAVVMLAISFVLLLVINALQWWAANRHKNSEPLEVAAGKAKAGEA